MRDTTERPEAVEAGTVRLVGTDADAIVAEATRLLTDPHAHAAMAAVHNPYGDGRAVPRIVDALAAWVPPAFALICGEINGLRGRYNPRFPTHERMSNAGTLTAERRLLSQPT